MGNPYVKMLSLVDPNKAAAEFHQLRGGKPNGNITYNAANGTSPNGGVQNGQTTLTLSDNLINTINTIGKYLPIALAIIALNALVVLVLAVAAVIYMCRRRNRVRARKTPGRMTPMPMNEGPQSTYEMPVARYTRTSLSRWHSRRTRSCHHHPLSRRTARSCGPCPSHEASSFDL